MSTLGIVVLSLLGGLFIAILIAAVVFLIWVCLKLHKAVIAAETHLLDVATKQSQELAGFEARTTNILQLHANAMATAVAKINGEALEAASKSLLAVAPRLEKSFIAFAELSKYLLADRDTIASNGAGLKPDEYATPEPGERFVGRGRTAENDFQASAEEDEHPTFPEGS
jgi:hypothetical protein